MRVLMRQSVRETCYISYARIVAILMAYVKSQFALAYVTNQGTPVYVTLEYFNTKHQHNNVQRLSDVSVKAEY
jgi:hypothetical protein